MTDNNKHIHKAAAAGYSSAAAIYVTGRPDYPAQVDDWLRDELRLGTGKSVLDLGAGTGKFTPKLVATGSKVSVVEPVGPMLDLLQSKLPTVTAVQAAAEAIPFEDASFDVVICAQAFHWFANAQAVAEITRVLKPGGRFGLIWNKRDQRTDWVAALTAIMRPYETGVPRHDHGDWKQFFPIDGFTKLRETAIPHGHTGSPEQVIMDRIMSVSFIAALPDDEKARVAAQINKLIAGTPALARRDAVTFPYLTAIYSCQKLP